MTRLCTAARRVVGWWTLDDFATLALWAFFGWVVIALVHSVLRVSGVY